MTRTSHIVRRPSFPVAREAARRVVSISNSHFAPCLRPLRVVVWIRYVEDSQVSAAPRSELRAMRNGGINSEGGVSNQLAQYATNEAETATEHRADTPHGMTGV